MNLLQELLLLENEERKEMLAVQQELIDRFDADDMSLDHTSTDTEGEVWSLKFKLTGHGATVDCVVMHAMMAFDATAYHNGASTPARGSANSIKVKSWGLNLNGHMDMVAEPDDIYAIIDAWMHP